MEPCRDGSGSGCAPKICNLERGKGPKIFIRKKAPRLGEFSLNPYARAYIEQRRRAAQATRHGIISHFKHRVLAQLKGEVLPGWVGGVVDTNLAGPWIDRAARG